MATLTPFDRKYAGLNAGQRKAVDAIDGPVMVIAGPGTGKTTILTLRIANILKMTDTPPSGILAITYTDAGVKAMRQKLAEIIGGRAHEVEICTFHGFAAAMIAEYPDHFVALQGLRNLTDVEQEEMIRGILLDQKFRDIRPLGKPDAYIPAILKTIDDAKREALMPEMVREYAKNEAERIKNDEDSISTRGATKGQLKADALERIAKCERTMLCADVYQKYEEEKDTSKRMDFNDLIFNLLVGLRNDELLLRLIQERFHYLMVDEHQDTNDAQNFIVSLIAEFFETPNVFIVGDEKQAIYRFQGASVENFLKLQKQWPAMQVISLDTNYRSHQGILDASFALIEHNYEGDEHRDLRVRLASGTSDAPRPIDVVSGENVAAVESHLVKGIKAVTAADPAATVAVITRRNRDLERIIRLLESNGIPVSSERSVDIFHHPIGAIFFDLIEYLADETRTDSLGLTIAAGMWGIPFEQGTKLIKALRSGTVSDIERQIPAIASLNREMLDSGAMAFLVHAAEASGFAGLAARDPASIHVWRGIVALSESLARERSIISPRELMPALLAYRLSAESKTVKVSVGAPDLKVKAMTAHGSKGLEFDHVFIPYATEEAWVGRARGSSFVLPEKRVDSSDIRDTRRLFYVALTRARKHVTVLTASEESDGRALSPLRFIAELDEKSTSAAVIPRLHPELPNPNSDLKKKESERADRMTALAKDVLVGTGLSVTALNHFLECPSKFLYLSILKLPQAPSVSAEKGTAMHEAMSRIWRAEDRSEASIETIIREAVTEFLDKSLLSIAEKAAVLKELTDNAPIVAKSLTPHFNAYKNASVYAERWAERTFDAIHDGQALQIPLHGKLDAIVDTGSKLDVFDYKTRQAMSDAEIKGETKNSSGDYFRQLVFYRYLLEGDSFWRGRSIVPALVFLSPDKKGRCAVSSVPIADADLKNISDSIQSVVDSVWSGKLVNSKCTDPQCEWCALASVSF